jgi:hypothetical protein
MAGEGKGRAIAPIPEEEEEDNVTSMEDVDVDLDALDEDLRRELAGKSTTVRIDGEVIHIIHAGDWSQTAMRSAMQGDWESWAREVIVDDREFATWMEADLRNYQVEAVFEQCGRQARMNAGKSRKHTGTRRNLRRR